MDVISSIRDKASKNKKVIVLPEYKDKRVIEAYERIKKDGIADVILLTPDRMEKNKLDLFSKQYFDLRKHKKITQEEAANIVNQPLYYAAMMVRNGEADGFVAGAVHTTPDVIRAAIHCIEIDERIVTVSSSFIMVVPDCPYGDNGLFVFADCGVMPDPSPKQLANIAIATAELAQKVLSIEPKVAMLSYSTKGSAAGEYVCDVREATELVKRAKPDLIIDGELQVDAAIIPEVAKIKDSSSRLKGDANVLIFPDLESGNIGYKLTQRLAKARAIGPLLQGLKKPCSDLSRGCEVDDIIDCVAVTAIRAVK